MKINRRECDYYAIQLTTSPPLEGTLEASFNGGATWIPGVLDETEIWTTWLVAGPAYDAAAVGQDPADVKAVITKTTTPILRLKENPVLFVTNGPKISFD